MRGLRVLTLVPRALLLLAGCSSKPSSPSASSNDPAALAQAQAIAGHPALAGGWQLDCKAGSFERDMNASWGQVWEARASHGAGPKEEMWTAVNPTNPKNVLVAAKDLNPTSSAPDSTGHCVWNGVFVTHDGGQTWHDVTIGGTYAERGPTSPFYGYMCNTAPDSRSPSGGPVHCGVER